MASKKTKTLTDGEYLAKCRQANALSAAMNGHAEVWPEARMVVSGDVAVFYRDDKRVWSCNMVYAANQFDVTPIPRTPVSAPVKIRLRWKLEPALTGLMVVGAGPRGSFLHDGEKTYARISATRDRKWFWVAGWDSDVPYRNTHDSPVGTADEAKAQAMAYVKSHNERSDCTRKKR